MLNYLNQSWLGSLLTIITFFIAIILAIYLFMKGRNLKKISLYSEYESILDKKPSTLSDSLDIFFQGKKVERFNKTRIYIWNSGNQTIYKKDIENIDPPKLCISDKAEILQISIVNMTREVINANIDCGKNDFFLVFDFLDTNDGLVLELLHTGEEVDINFSGTIIGINEKISLFKKSSKFKNFIKDLSSTMGISLFPFFDKKFGLISTSIGLIVFLVGLAIIFEIGFLGFKNSFSEGIFISYVGLCNFVIGLVTYNLLKEPYPKKLKI